MVMLGIFLVFVFLTCMVALAQYNGDTSVANFSWGGGVTIVTLYTYITLGSFLPRQSLLFIITCAWSLRLFKLVYKRYTGKDPRFATWKWHGTKALLMNCLWIYGQFIMIAIMSYPALLINFYQVPGITLYDIIGLCAWIIGYVYETVSDEQLFAFLRNPAHQGRVLQTGLWRYSRHPNYFGETVMWWGIFCMVLSVPYGWTALITPITITFMLVCVTGIPLLEHAMMNNPAYQEYKRKTSAFIPWFPCK